MRLGEWDAIRGELLSMAEEDLQVRSELAKDGSLFEGYHPRMRATHDANATRLQSILDSLGWPGERQVGHEAAEAAWLIVQHAIAQPNLQRRALELLRVAVDHGDAPAAHARHAGGSYSHLRGPAPAIRYAVRLGC